MVARVVRWLREQPRITEGIAKIIVGIALIFGFDVDETIVVSILAGLELAGGAHTWRNVTPLVKLEEDAG